MNKLTACSRNIKKNTLPHGSPTIIQAQTTSPGDQRDHSASSRRCRASFRRLREAQIRRLNCFSRRRVSKCRSAQSLRPRRCPFTSLPQGNAPRRVRTHRCLPLHLNELRSEARRRTNRGDEIMTDRIRLRPLRPRPLLPLRSSPHLRARTACSRLQRPHYSTPHHLDSPSLCPTRKAR